MCFDIFGLGNVAGNTQTLNLSGAGPVYTYMVVTMIAHDDVIKWKYFPLYCPYVRGNSPVSGEFPSQRPVTRSFNVFFDLRLE